MGKAEQQGERRSGTQLDKGGTRARDLALSASGAGGFFRELCRVERTQIALVSEASPSGRLRFNQIAVVAEHSARSLQICEQSVHAFRECEPLHWPLGR